MEALSAQPVPGLLHHLNRRLEHKLQEAYFSLKCVARKRRSFSGPLRAGLFVIFCYYAVIPVLAVASSAGIFVHGPGVEPQLWFACCDQGDNQMQSLFSDPHVIADLKDLHAGLGVPISDFSPERAQLVRRLNQAGIPVIAGLVLPKGYYFNADDAAQAQACFAAFDAWSREQGLRWNGVGLDIEPDFGELTALKDHKWQLVSTLLGRAVDFQRMRRAQRVYSALIANIRSRGYFVQTYQLPYLPVERKAHSSLLDRTLGTVDVRGDQEVLMLYTSFAGPSGAAIIWKLGPDAQSIAICCTDGDPEANSAVLDWSRFSRDLIVAGHFSHMIGVYNLEGCIRQGFLQRLKAVDWSQSVTIPADDLRRVDRRLGLLMAVLWIGENLFYIVIVLMLLFAGVVWRWRIRKRRRSATERPKHSYQIHPPIV
jgi:hypothetical protein